jgi:phosphopantothenoylcysteine decarboxylase / phosphopantothenate---cysteine ligase
MGLAPKTIIVGVTASIAAYKACEIVNLLKKDSFNVKVILTRDALEFVMPLTFQTLSGNKVFTDMFELSDKHSPEHISLADSASLVLIAPATANVIGKLAGGICDDLLTCVVYATKAPVLIAPAMNENMYNHEGVKGNIAKLKEVGYSFVGPVKGHLACGRDAIGHIAEVSDIIKEAKKLLK